jgi:ABC-type multidrug transport system permease subunit
MRFLIIALNIAGALFVIFGIIFFLFLFGLNDPEIEGDSGRISLGTYFLSLIPIAIGVLFFIISLKVKKKSISN